MKLLAKNYFISVGNYSGDDFMKNTSGSGIEERTSGSGSTGVCHSAFQECLPPRVCGGSASVERGFVTEFTQPDQPSCNPHSDDTFRVITEQKDHDNNIIRMNGECNEEELYL